MGKYKKYIWMAGLYCALPLTVSGQQVDPLTGADRLFNEGGGCSCVRIMRQPDRPWCAIPVRRGKGLGR